MLTVTMLLMADLSLAATVINFEDVPVSDTDLTNRYESAGVTLRSIANPFPLPGAFPSPEYLPSVLGGVVSWTFPSSPELGVTAIADREFITPTEYLAQGNNGILISFDFDVTSVSVTGVDAGYGFPSPLRDEDEAVTLTAYDVAGNKIGYAYSTLNRPGPYDITPAIVEFPNIRHVAFNYTGDSYGFYSLDDLTFVRAVPVPGSLFLFGSGFGLLALLRVKNKRAKQ